MARSMGEAVSGGLESGVRLGLALRQDERQRRRQDEQDAFERDDRALRTADRQTAHEDRQRRLRREERGERLGALQGQEAAIRSELATLPAGDTSPRAQQLLERRRGLSTMVNKELVGAGGYDFESDEREARADAQLFAAGRGGELTPARRVRALAASARRDLRDFRRGPAGEPSKVGAAVEDFGAGMSGGDTDRMIRGANVLLAPDLQRGIGEDSPHGGKIIGKEVVAFDQAPNSTPDDPQLIPRLRVWVKGQAPKNDEEKRLMARWKAANPGIPEGATGFYLAPVTEDRSIRPDAPVKVLGMKAGLQYMNSLKQMEEWLNDPAVAADVEAGLGQWDQQRFLRERAAAGLPPPLSTKYQAIGSGGLLKIETDARTGQTREQVIANPNPSNTPELTAARIRLLERQAEDEAASAALRGRTDPNRRGGGRGGGSLKTAPVEKLTAQLSQFRMLLKATNDESGGSPEVREDRKKRIAGYQEQIDEIADELKRRRQGDKPGGGKLSDAPGPAGTPAPAARPPLSSFMR